MYAVRFGSYSIAATRAGKPSFWRLKSILRYRRLAQPPRWGLVIRPWVLRPPDFLSPSVSAFSGSFLVTSARSDHVAKRLPGLVGLCRLTAIGHAPRVGSARWAVGRIGPKPPRTAVCALRTVHRALIRRS